MCEWFCCCKTAYRDAFASFAGCARVFTPGKSTHSVDSIQSQTEPSQFAKRRVEKELAFDFVFGSATNYNLFDRNSAKYKNINNDIMWFLLLLVSWDPLHFPALFFYGLLQPLCFFYIFFAFFLSSFCLTFISATERADVPQLKEKQIECQMQCEHKEEKRAKEKEKNKIEIKIVAKRREKLQVQFLAALMMSRWVFLSISSYVIFVKRSRLYK